MTTGDDIGRGRRDEPGRSHEEEQASRLLHGLPDASPRSAFRDRLRAEFAQGRVPPSPALRRERRWRWLVPVGLAVPALAILLLAPLANRGAGWKIVEPVPGARLVVDGVELPMGDAGSIQRVSRLLRGGSRLELHDSVVVNLEAPGRLVLQLLPRSDLVLPGVPGRWYAREVQGQLATGELRITTSPGFRGSRLRVSTPEVDVDVTGTTLAVIRPDFGTCVCVFDGTVHVAPRGGVPERVEAGHRFTFHREENVIDRGEILPEERMKLGALQSLCSPAHVHPSHGLADSTGAGR